MQHPVWDHWAIFLFWQELDCLQMLSALKQWQQSGQCSCLSLFPTSPTHSEMYRQRRASVSGTFILHVGLSVKPAECFSHQPLLVETTESYNHCFILRLRSISSMWILGLQRHLVVNKNVTVGQCLLPCVLHWTTNCCSFHSVTVQTTDVF